MDYDELCLVNKMIELKGDTLLIEKDWKEAKPIKGKIVEE